MASLAPNAHKIGSLNIRNPVVNITAMIRSIEKLLLIIFSASSLFFSPIFIAQSGAPPIPIKALNAEISISIGNATPTPAIANSPLSILPMNILSTMLYRTLTSWATIAGAAKDISNLPILPFPKSFVFFIHIPLFLNFNSYNIIVIFLIIYNNYYFNYL